MTEPVAQPPLITISKVIGEMAGAVSVCWEPQPIGIFDAKKAREFVDQARAEIRQRLEGRDG